MKDKITVLLSVDCPLLEAGVSASLTDIPDIKVIGAAYTSHEAIQKLNDSCPDVIVIAFLFSQLPVLTIAQHIKSSRSNTKALILSPHEKVFDMIGLIHANVFGYMLTSEKVDNIVAAIRTIAEGGIYCSKQIINKALSQAIGSNHNHLILTTRELEILGMIGEGRNNIDMASVLSISERTIRFHLSNIYDKIGVSSRSDAIIWAIRHNIVSI